MRRSRPRRRRRCRAKTQPQRECRNLAGPHPSTPLLVPAGCRDGPCVGTMGWLVPAGRRDGPCVGTMGWLVPTGRRDGPCVGTVAVGGGSGSCRQWPWISMSQKRRALPETRPMR